jgi:hypothetical protein
MDSHKKFLKRIKKTENGCWEWAGSVSPYGYGQFSYPSGNRAHRYAYEYYVGKIPKGLQLDHLCRNRKCVNPQHLEAVTNKENVLRGVGLTAINAKKTHCKNGHELAGNNLYLAVKKDKSVQRICVICKRTRLSIWRHRVDERLEYRETRRCTNCGITKKDINSSHSIQCNAGGEHNFSYLPLTRSN